MDTYKADDTLHHVNLEVDVGTTAIAVTSVFWDNQSGSKHLFDSAKFAGGDIPYRKVGNNKDMKGTSLDVRIALDYSNIPEDSWPEPDKVKEEVSVEIKLKGGPEGEKPFGIGFFNIDPTNMPEVFISKKIELV